MAEKSLRTWISEQVYERLIGGFAAWFTTLVETRLRQSHVELLSEMEDQARQLEADGKTELAEQLRTATTSQSLEQAGCLGLNFVSHLHTSQQAQQLKLESVDQHHADQNNVEQQTDDQNTTPDSQDPPASKPRRPRRRRSGDASKSEKKS